VSSKLLFFEL
jgi:hypothetical protein